MGAEGPAVTVAIVTAFSHQMGDFRTIFVFLIPKRFL